MDFDRRKFNKLWLLFVVFATGLVWTWSQVAQRSTPPAPVDGEAIELLRVEEGCDLARAACAAYAPSFAVVASVKAEGEGLRWRVKGVGDGLPALPEVALTLMPPRQPAQPLQVVKVSDQWQAYSPGLVRPGSVLRLRVSGGERPWVADFPIGGGQ